MAILGRRVFRGPHYYSQTPMVRIQLDLGALESHPTDKLPGFTDRLLEMLPGLEQHGCSYRQAGGLVRRLRDGTWLGHVAEHVALELQTLAGHRRTRGKTRSVKGRPGVYNIMYAYEQEDVGLAAGGYALRLVDHLLPVHLQGLTGYRALLPDDAAAAFDLDAALTSLRRLVRAGQLGPTTRSLVAEARRRGIPVLRLDEHSFIQLGHGSRQKRIRASITSDTSHIAVETAGNKALTKSLLEAAGLPTARGEVVRTFEEAVAAARRFGYPLVTKPLNGNHGRGVTTGISDHDGLRRGFDLAAPHSPRVIVEQMLQGRDHRFLVIGGKVEAIAERTAAAVTGDGIHSITELVEIENRDPRRGDGHENVMTRIVIDRAVTDRLARLGLDAASVPAAGEIVELRDTANLSTGGAAIDRTEAAHPDNIAIAEQAAAVIGLDIAGLDFLIPDVARSVRETGGGIVEINAAPGFRMHLAPSVGLARDVARPALRALFPQGRPSRIPIFAITGTNGKSTTGRMVASILAARGQRVGLTNTSGIYVDGRLVMAADASGPRSARMVLRNPKADAAVFEVARGGILREGLGFDACDVGAVLNISADHLGLKGVDTLEELAGIKSVVVGSVRRRGYSILNADDPLTVKMRRRAGGQVVFFSMRGGDDMPSFLRAHIAEGGTAVVLEPAASGGDVVVHAEGERIRVMAAADIPATLGGAARFNVANALAAVAMTYPRDQDLASIRSGLAAFVSDFEQNPGRLNVYDGLPFRVIVDYAHNPPALAALSELVRSLAASGRRTIGMVSIPGDRRDEDIREMGALAVGIFDEIVFRERPDGRGRREGEVLALLYDGALAAGGDPGRIRRVIDEPTATRTCLDMAAPGDLVVLLPTQIDAVWSQVKAYRRPSGSTSDPGGPRQDEQAEAARS
jgi:cyanophycin synthetase